MKKSVLMFALACLLITGAVAESQPDIVGVLAKSPNHKTFSQLVKTAGLVDTLKAKGPFTVFAPTDAAFAKLPKATLDSLKKPENKDKLKSILLYHIINGRVTSRDLMGMKSPTSVSSLNGAKLTITHTKSAIKVNKATVIKPDLTASNGIVHTIDAVLMPPGKKR